MAQIIRIATVIAYEIQVVILCDVLWELVDEFLGSLPEGLDSCLVLWQTNDEAVLLVIVPHELEGVEMNVTEVFYAGLYTPIVVKLKHEFVSEKESRLIAAHVPVAFRVSVNDFFSLHRLPGFRSLVLVDPVWV